MERKVIIFGTDHRYQSRDAEIAEDVHVAFYHTIREKVRHLGPSAIAEECNPMALKELGIPSTTVKLIADELDIPHRYCDPDLDVREELGIFQENQIRILLGRNWSEDRIKKKLQESFEKRESYWATELIDFDLWPVLFVCGANHVKSFSIVLESKGLVHEISEHDWGA